MDCHTVAPIMSAVRSDLNLSSRLSSRGSILWSVENMVENMYSGVEVNGKRGRRAQGSEGAAN